jgi:hypothetical protein
LNGQSTPHGTGSFEPQQKSSYLNNRSLSIRVFLIGSILLQAAFCVMSWKNLLKDPELNGIDFVSFYTAGRIARSGDYAHLYDLQAQIAIQNKLIPPAINVAGVNQLQYFPYLHSPYMAPLLSLIAGDDYLKSYMVWSAVLFFMILFCGLVIYKYLLSADWDRTSAILYSLNSILFYPLMLSLLKGQDTAFILFGLLFWMFGLLQGRDLLSGFGLALSTLSPPLGGALALPSITSGRRAGRWFCLAFVLLSLFSLSLVGFKGAIDFFHLFLLSSQGQGYALNQDKMFNFLGLMLRSFPTLNLDLVHTLSWGVTLLSLMATGWFWWKFRAQIKAEHIGLVVVIALFSSPHLHSHSLSMLLLPLLGLSVYLWKSSSRLAQIAAVTLIPICSLCMEASNIAGETGFFAFTYFLMAALAGWFIYYTIQNSKSIPLSDRHF